MVMGPVIEIIGDTRVKRLQSFAEKYDCVLAIGRALDNDIILDDPFVDPHHGQIVVTSTGDWSYQDLGSENGSMLGKRSISSSALQSTDVLNLGKTQLQVFAAEHTVPPALSIRNSRQRLLSFNSLPVTIALLLSALLLLMLNIYLNYTGEEIRFSNIVGLILGAFTVPLVVGTAWSLLSKILRGRSHFRSVINVTFIALIALELFEYPFIALAYNLPSTDQSYIGAIIDVGIFAAYLYATLLICTRLNTRISGVIAGLVPVAVFSFYLVNQVSNADEHSNYPNYNGRILAPMVLLRSGESTDDFMRRLPDIFDEADKLID
jgi:hypothetical protein